MSSRSRPLHAPARMQRGAALIALAALLVLGTAWLLVSAVNAPQNRIAAGWSENANVLAQAKQGLIAWAAQRAIDAAEDNPGRIPCPEAAGNIGTTNEGIAAGSCTPTAVGRLPWRTLGLPKLRDASGEPLWYAVSPGWALPNTSTLLTIHSNSVGQLAVDGQTNAAVALIIAPGRPLSTTGTPSCTARTQARGAIPPNFCDYIESVIDRAATPPLFATTGSSPSFNDQVLKVTAADVLPVIEAAIAKRIERDVAPRLRAVYTNATAPAWVPAGKTLFPFAAPFADPIASNYQGESGRHQGLLPLARAQDCPVTSPPTPGCPKVDPTFVRWSADTQVLSGIAVSTCSLTPVADPTEVICTLSNISALPTLTVNLRATVNVFQALRSVNGPVAATAPAVAASSAGGFLSGCTASWTVSASGATLQCSGDMDLGVLGKCKKKGVEWKDCASKTVEVWFTIPRIGDLLADHPLLDPGDVNTGWFLRNGWHTLAYYAISPGYAAGAPLSCAGVTCLSVAGLTPPDNKRAILVSAGRALPGQTRPAGLCANYLDGLNQASCGSLGNTFEQRKVGLNFNDRAVVLDANP